MNDYNPNHFRFIRNSHSRRSEFQEEPDDNISGLIVLAAAIIVLIAVLVLE